MTDRCPECGAPYAGGSGNVARFGCDTTIIHAADDDKVEVSKPCLRRQLAATDEKLRELEQARKIAEDRLTYAEETHADYRRTAETRNEDLRRVLERVEWSLTVCEGVDVLKRYCPSCRRLKPRHAPDCELDALLRGDPGPVAAVVEAAGGFVETLDRHLEENRKIYRGESYTEDDCQCCDICCEAGESKRELEDALSALGGGVDSPPDTLSAPPKPSVGHGADCPNPYDETRRRIVREVKALGVEVEE